MSSREALFEICDRYLHCTRIKFNCNTRVVRTYVKRNGPCSLFSVRAWSVQYPFNSRLTSIFLKRSSVKQTLHGRFFGAYRMWLVSLAIILYCNNYPRQREDPLDIPTNEDPLDIPTNEDPLDIPTNEDPLDIPTNEDPLDIPTNEDPLDIPTNEDPLDIPTNEDPLDIPTN